MKKVINTIIVEKEDLYSGCPEGISPKEWDIIQELYRCVGYKYMDLNDEQTLTAINSLIASKLSFAIVHKANVIVYDPERLELICNLYTDASSAWGRLQWVLGNWWHPYPFGLPEWADLGELASPKVPEDMPRAEAVLDWDEMECLNDILNVGTPKDEFFEALERLRGAPECYVVRNSRVVMITQDWLATIANLGRQMIDTYAQLLEAIGVIR